MLLPGVLPPAASAAITETVAIIYSHSYCLLFSIHIIIINAVVVVAIAVWAQTARLGDQPLCMLTFRQMCS